MAKKNWDSMLPLSRSSLPLATLGDATHIGSFLFILSFQRWPSQGQGTRTLSKTIISTMTLTIKVLFETLRINGTQHNNNLSLCWVVHFTYCYAECQYVKCHYSECHYLLCHGAKTALSVKCHCFQRFWKNLPNVNPALRRLLLS